jgi:hypothetical protein
MGSKRILISYFFGKDTIPLGESFAKAFCDKGYDVCRFGSQVESLWYRALLKPANRLARWLGRANGEIGRSLPISRVNFKKHLMRRAVREFRPRWVFVIRAHEFMDADLVHELKHDFGVEKVFAWRVDGPLDTPDLREDARRYDCYFCSHRQGYEPLSDRIHYLPVYGMDFALYRNLYAASPRPYHHDFVLVGGHNARREQFVNHLLDSPLEIYGQWGRQKRASAELRKHVKAKGVWGEELVKLYNTTKIVLNVTNWDPARYVALNQRVFDVPATGAFLLTDYSPEIEEHYKPGEEIVCYRDVDELAHQVRYFLTHEERRAAIARKGYEKALTLPTIGDRVQTVIRHVERT